MCDVVHVCTSSSSQISSAAGAETCENVDLFLAAPSHSTLTWPVRRPAPPPVNGPSGIFDDLFATSQPLGISLFASGGAWPNLPIGPAFQCVIFCSFFETDDSNLRSFVGRIVVWRAAANWREGTK